MKALKGLMIKLRLCYMNKNSLYFCRNSMFLFFNHYNTTHCVFNLLIYAYKHAHSLGLNELVGRRLFFFF